MVEVGQRWRCTNEEWTFAFGEVFEVTDYRKVKGLWRWRILHARGYVYHHTTEDLVANFELVMGRP